MHGKMEHNVDLDDAIDVRTTIVTVLVRMHY